MNRNNRTAPGGFTLIELLVAMAIIAILIALLGVALSKTTERQKNNSSKQQADKLQKSMDAEVERIVKQCNADRGNGVIPPAITSYCDINADRALAVWTAMNLRRQFPESFAEAQTDVTVNGFTLKRLATFDEVQTLTTGTLQANEESGILLYIILAKKSVSGNGAMANAADDLTQGMTKSYGLGGKPFTAFADAWDNAMGFKRWYTGGPVQGSPFTDPKLTNKDPLDPRNLIGGWMDPAAPAQLNVKRVQLQTLGLFALDNLNRTATVYAPGKDKLPLTGDDILGINSRRYGN